MSNQSFRAPRPLHSLTPPAARARHATGVGIVVGTYSSIYTASATALLLGVNAQDLLEPVKDPDLIDDLP